MAVVKTSMKLGILKRIPVYQNKTGILCYNIYPVHREIIDQLVIEGQFFSYSEAARYIIRTFLDYESFCITHGYIYSIHERKGVPQKISSKFPPGLLSDIKNASEILGITRSAFIRRAFDWFIDRLEREKQ